MSNPATGSQPLLGRGLLEVSVIAALLGTTVAERLTLGYKGAGGLAWSSVSIFGAVHVAKVAVAASLSDWYRESLGLRNAIIDASVGLVTRVDELKGPQHRSEWGNPVAIFNAHNKEGTLKRRAPKLVEPQSEFPINVGPENQNLFQAVYCADHNIAFALQTIKPTPRERPVPICEFKYDSDGSPKIWKDWLLMATSLVKIVESMTLFAVSTDGNSLWWITLVPTIITLLAASILQILGIGRISRRFGVIDVVSGDLPSATSFGGSGKILLGLPGNIRREPHWRVAWGVIGLVNLFSLFACFVALAYSSPTIVYIWMGFQAWWLGARSLAYHLADSSICSYQAIIASAEWEETPPQQKTRVLALVTALGQLQVPLNHRSLIPYAHDAPGWNVIRQLLRRTHFQITDTLTYNSPPISKVEVLGVIGASILRAVAWIRGLRIADLQLHDACIIFLRLPGEESTLLAVPSTRVFARKTGGTVTWLLWVPTKTQGEIGWTGSATREMVGIVNCEFLRDNEVDKTLELREWDHALRNSTEIARVTKAAREASGELLEMWQNTEE